MSVIHVGENHAVVAKRIITGRYGDCHECHVSLHNGRCVRPAGMPNCSHILKEIGVCQDETQDHKFVLHYLKVRDAD